MSYEIKLPFFEGPFDLLLFFIERDELDIHDIPISKIADEFLEYIKQMEHLNIEVASEFILVAATLMRIKSKMLLPRPQIDEAGNEIDPRDELVRHLLEYKRFKEVVGQLTEMEEKELLREKRGNLLKEVRSLSETVNVESELQDVDLYKLLKVYAKVLRRHEEEMNKPTHTVVEYPFTIARQKEYILEKVRDGQKIAFTEILADDPTKIAVIFNFLAILELLQLTAITIVIGEGFNNFWIEKGENVTAENVG